MLFIHLNGVAKLAAANPRCGSMEVTVTSHHASVAPKMHQDTSANQNEPGRVSVCSTFIPLIFLSLITFFILETLKRPRLENLKKRRLWSEPWVRGQRSCQPCALSYCAQDFWLQAP